ncbi:hypothetical protein Ancab_004060 [Ancistrocladus abbreviatus]
MLPRWFVVCHGVVSAVFRGPSPAFFFGKNTVDLAMLHAFEPDLPNDPAGSFSIIGKLKDLVPVLVNCFDEFIPWVYSQPFNGIHSHHNLFHSHCEFDFDVSISFR